MRVDLKGQAALVTGAAHRVGRVIALELAQRGTHILLHYHSASPERARHTLREIKSYGVDAQSVRADLSRPDEIEALMAAAGERFDGLDIVVNSAAIFQKRAFLEVSLDDWERTMAVNLRAPFLITQAAARLMLAKSEPGGAIVNICDAGVDGPWREYPHHGLSKSALWMLTRTSALALGPAIRVNAVVSGPIMKTAGRDISDADWAKVGERSVLRRTGQPEDVARAVAYLCSEDHITGALLHINAGEHLP